LKNLTTWKSTYVMRKVLNSEKNIIKIK